MISFALIHSKGLDPQRFVDGLRPLQPRLYSIASSLSICPDEAHITIAPVRYKLHGEPRSGVASGHLADRAIADSVLPVYIQSNPHFRLPSNGEPIIMIGAGTGVAPIVPSCKSVKQMVVAVHGCFR